jgi:hypothetical protein
MSNLRTEHEIEIDKIHDRQLAEKDAEIERLKAQVKELSETLQKAIREMRRALSLITELCDALKVHSVREPVINDLIERAREASEK